MKDQNDNYRAELTSILRYNPWPGRMTIKYYMDMNSEFDDMVKSQIKATYAYPIMDSPVHAVVQYTYFDNVRTYDETLRFGIGFKF